MRCQASTCVLMSLVLTVLCSCSRQASTLGEGTNYASIESGLIEFVSPAGVFAPDSTQRAHPGTLVERMDHYDVPGVSLAIVDDDRVAWARAYGVMDADTGAPVTRETIFEAASTSKLVTSVMALHFIQEGAIDLDADVNDHLISWQVPENEFTARQKVTLRRLLTHMAGMPTTNFGHEEGAAYPTLLDVLNGTPPALNAPAAPELEPGTQWQYSNVAYGVIQLLLEDVGGKPFPQLATELVFEPLGMTHSSFAYPLEPEHRALEAMPHDADGVSREPAMHLTALGHAGLTTTPTDLARFTNELLLSYRGESERVLSAASTRLLLTKEFDLDPQMFGIPLSEGLGVLLMGEGRDLLFAHPGSNLPGLNCWLVGWPERGKGIVVMTNGAKGELLAMEVVSAFGIMD